MPNIKVGNELALALAEVGPVRHQRDFRRQLEALHRLGHLHRIERLRLRGRERASVHRREAEPGARGRNVAAAPLADFGDEFLHVRNVRLLPVPFEHPGADAGFRRQAEQHFQLLLRAGQMELLVEAELHRLLERVDRVIAGLQEDDDVRLRRLRLDQVGGVIGGAERGQIAAELGAAELGRRLFQAACSVWPKA